MQFQHLTVQVTFERRDIDLNKTVLVDVHKRLRLIHRGDVHPCGIHTAHRQNFMWIVRQDVCCRKTNSTPDTFSVYHRAGDRIKTA